MLIVWACSEGVIANCSRSALDPRRDPTDLARSIVRRNLRLRSADLFAILSLQRHRDRRGGAAGYRFQPTSTTYRARLDRDFWRRWHISLSTWLRDYLFIPLGAAARQMET